ncbi:pyridoxamine 5'-phosphate oxidase family protein [Paenibacillus validus]|uniref:pyridoxamine 5'-phosphate oxidase family protein n=1 Tax=Paenibacillus validus TaxID=44253 RepID=UPI000FDA2C02|nr:pyridoxamine 5'-phosphate oxidase family protein [Paenibacillus validus]MED4599503.1 pyridoxamine 5'-phosphate oxidase family protein [Paenibacillus validus]MED4606701.1 pyridoxamine 5'-phosphate oxidase family protein [Paenibacillus validus]
MQQTELLEDQIAGVLAANRICSFGTVDGNKPMVRDMALFHEGLTLYLATNSKTDKVDELQNNPNVHVLVGYDGKRSSDILQIQARAEICKDNALRERLWNESFKAWFQGPHDPDYVILEIKPERIEYNSANAEPRVWQK